MATRVSFIVAFEELRRRYPGLSARRFCAATEVPYPTFARWWPVGSGRAAVPWLIASSARIDIPRPGTGRSSMLSGGRTTTWVVAEWERCPPDYVLFYNRRRCHSALDYATPRQYALQRLPQAQTSHMS